MSPLVAALVLSALSVRGRPAALTLGKDASAQIEIAAVDAGGRPWGAQVQVSASVGRVSTPERLGAGRYRVRFTPPAERFPQAAILLVTAVGDGRSEHRWLTVPLDARASLRIETKPRAKVKVTIGSRTFGPATADAAGRVTVSAVVPPGVPVAMVNATDEAGNTTSKPLDLPRRPFPRVHFRPPERPASWADAEPARVELYAILPDGRPLTDAGLIKVEADRGSLAGTPVQLEPGVFELRYRAPPSTAPSTDTLTGCVEGSPPVTAQVALQPGPPHHLGLSFTPDRYVAGSRQEVAIHSELVDAHGNPIRPVEAQLSVDVGTLTGRGSAQALEPPDHFSGRTEVRVRAAADGLVGEGHLPLRAGAPEHALLMPSRGFARPGEPLEGTLLVTDAYGNPATGAAVSVRVTDGGVASVTDLGGGRYRFEYRADVASRPGRFELLASSQERALAAPTWVLMLPPARPWSLSLGAALAAQTDFHHANALAPRLSLGLRLGRTQVEGLLDADYHAYAAFPVQAVLVAGPGEALPPGAQASVVSSSSSIQAVSLAVGARYSVPVAPWVALYGSAVLGAMRGEARLDAVVTETVGGTTQTFSTSARKAFAEPMARLGAGASWQVGPGRAMGGLSLELVHGPAALGPNAGLSGLGLTAGYILDF